MICGHTPQRDGKPVNLGYAICLDTAACEGQWLTGLEVTSGKVLQTNQQRQVRRSHIQDYLSVNLEKTDKPVNTTNLSGVP
jgi:serine/threonine protein phosphatase 1